MGVSVQGFPPLEAAAAEVLILGSMPGEASLAVGEYYANPRNQFWPIMGELVGARPELPYRERCRLLAAAGIALWDVLLSCNRAGSLDARIEKGSIVTNDFDRFFARHPRIVRVFFNGAAAEACFRSHVLPTLKARPLCCRRLPSTSPANAGISFAEKLLAWRAVTEPGRG